MTDKILFVHEFPDTASARDAASLGTAVSQGDVLVVDSEEVVGVATSFSFAVTTAKGHLTSFCFDSLTYNPADLLDVVQGIQGAVAEAQRRGFEVDPAFDRFKRPAPAVDPAPATAADQKNTAVLAAAIKKHIESAEGYAALGQPVTPRFCAEAIARTFARFANIDSKSFLDDCGIK